MLSEWPTLTGEFPCETHHRRRSCRKPTPGSGGRRHEEKGDWSGSRRQAIQIGEMICRGETAGLGSHKQVLGASRVVACSCRFVGAVVVHHLRHRPKPWRAAILRDVLRAQVLLSAPAPCSCCPLNLGNISATGILHSTYYLVLECLGGFELRLRAQVGIYRVVLQRLSQYKHVGDVEVPAVWVPISYVRPGGVQ